MGCLFSVSFSGHVMQKYILTNKTVIASQVITVVSIHIQKQSSIMKKLNISHYKINLLFSSKRKSTSNNLLLHYSEYHTFYRECCF